MPVVQLNDEILARIAPSNVNVTELDPYGEGVSAILLEDLGASSPQLSRGRRVWLTRRRTYTGYGAGPDQVNIISLDRNAAVSRDEAPRVALLGHGEDATQHGAEVVVVSDRHPGQVGTVAALVDDIRVRVDFGDGNDFVTGLFIPLLNEAGELPVPAEPTAEDMALSDFWVKRIKEHAARAKSRHGFCAQIDKVVAELLEPALPKFTVDSPNPDYEGFDVLDPSGKKVAWFVHRAEAEADAKSRTKKLNS